MDSQPAPAPARTTAYADVLASVVVFMVALPLCIGIAQACGLPPEAGIVTGVVGGLLVGFLAGSPLQVSGPAAGLIVLVLDFLDDAHQAGHTGAAAVALLGLAILIAGLIQIAAGVCRIGQWFRAVTPAVVEGMLAGIGVTIIAKQFHVMVDDKPPKDIVDGLLTIPDAVAKGFYTADGAAIHHREAAVIGLLTITVLVLWKLLKRPPLKFVPSAVVAIVLAVVLNEFGRPLFEALGLATGPSDNGGLGVERVSVSSNLLSGLALLPEHWPGWGVLASGLVWKAAVAFALIASAETLLCATAVDGMHSGPRTKYDRELIAQGVGNAVCGVLGALPMTGVIVRSSANVDAGAKTRLSAILHGAWLLLFVSLLPGVLSLLPVAALAAVLVYTGWRLVNPAGLVRLWKESKWEAAVFVITAATIVATDLLAGVVTGVLLSAARLLWVVSHLVVERADYPDEKRTDLVLAGAATFMRLPMLAEALDAVPAGWKVHVHLDRVRVVDHAVLHLLTSFQQQYEAKGGEFVMDWDTIQSHFRHPQMVSSPDLQVPPQEALEDGNNSATLWRNRTRRVEKAAGA